MWWPGWGAEAQGGRGINTEDARRKRKLWEKEVGRTTRTTLYKASRPSAACTAARGLKQRKHRGWGALGRGSRGVARERTHTCAGVLVRVEDASAAVLELLADGELGVAAVDSLLLPLAPVVEEVGQGVARRDDAGARLRALVCRVGRQRGLIRERGRRSGFRRESRGRTRSSGDTSFGRSWRRFGGKEYTKTFHKRGVAEAAAAGGGATSVVLAIVGGEGGVIACSINERNGSEFQNAEHDQRGPFSTYHQANISPNLKLLAW